MSVTTTVRPPAKKKRGRESAGDMIRSMGLVVLIIVPIWFLAQPPSSDSKAIRVVDTAPAIAEYRQLVPTVPVPTTVPGDWKPTSATVDPGQLRIGYVTPGDGYLEYSSSTAGEADLPALTGNGTEVGSFTVDGVPWRQFEDAEEHTSLVRDVPGAVVLVGGVRETTTLDQLRVLAAAVR